MIWSSNVNQRLNIVHQIINSVDKCRSTVCYAQLKMKVSVPIYNVTRKGK
jgi:hypothetical protein